MGDKEKNREGIQREKKRTKERKRRRERGKETEKKRKRQRGRGTEKMEEKERDGCRTSHLKKNENKVKKQSKVCFQAKNSCKISFSEMNMF